MAESVNADLRAMIRDLAKRRDSVDRRQVYHALVQAKVWTPVSATSVMGDVQPADLQPLDREALGGLASFSVFTHQSAAESWQTEEAQGVVLRLERMAFADLLPTLLDAGAGSLYINPAAKFSGELYRHELETMLDGVKIIKRRQRMAAARVPEPEPTAAPDPPSWISRWFGWLK